MTTPRHGTSPRRSAAMEPQLRAKHPRSPLAGPYGHPFHPILVTIPIGTWVASLVFDIIGFVADEPRAFVIGAMVLIAIGLVGAVLAAIVGLIDLAAIAPGTPARGVALAHMTINLTAVVILLASLIIRMNADHDSVSVLGFVLSVVAILGVAVSGWLGGKLAYQFGVRVADEAKQAEGFR